MLGLEVLDPGAPAAGPPQPNRCTVFGIGGADAKPFLASEHIRGVSLDARIGQA